MLSAAPTQGQHLALSSILFLNMTLPFIFLWLEVYLQIPATFANFNNLCMDYVCKRRLRHKEAIAEGRKQYGVTSRGLLEMKQYLFLNSFSKVFK